MKPSQPLKWHGGKSYLASWIIEHFPSRDRYTHYNEPFAGGLSVLLAHDPNGKSESVNDLNGDLSNFWAVMRSEKRFGEFLRRCSSQPFEQRAFDVAKSYQRILVDDGADPWAAFQFFVKMRMSRQGLGRDYATTTTRTRRGMNENVSAWLSAVDGLPEIHERLRQVEVRNMDAVKFIEQYDHEKALFYLDPPYMPETRVTTKDYEYEMSAEDHKELLECLNGIKGMFLLSGYPCLMYSEYAVKNGWKCVHREIDNKASGKKSKEKKVEALWMNYVR